MVQIVKSIKDKDLIEGAMKIVRDGIYIILYWTIEEIDKLELI